MGRSPRYRPSFPTVGTVRSRHLGAGPVLEHSRSVPTSYLSHLRPFCPHPSHSPRWPTCRHIGQPTCTTSVQITQIPSGKSAHNIGQKFATSVANDTCTTKVRSAAFSKRVRVFSGTVIGVWWDCVNRWNLGVCYSRNFLRRTVFLFRSLFGLTKGFCDFVSMHTVCPYLSCWLCPTVVTYPVTTWCTWMHLPVCV